MTPQQEPKSCPFCGSAPKTNGSGWIYCPKLNCPGSYAASPPHLWNTRVNDGDTRRLDWGIENAERFVAIVRSCFHNNAMPDLRAAIDTALREPADTQKEAGGATAEEQCKPWRSKAQWPVRTSRITDDFTTDDHYTEEEAKGVCALLEKNGYGGDGQIFPTRTWVEHRPIPSLTPQAERKGGTYEPFPVSPILAEQGYRMLEVGEKPATGDIHGPDGNYYRATQGTATPRTCDICGKPGKCQLRETFLICEACSTKEAK